MHAGHDGMYICGPPHSGGGCVEGHLLVVHDAGGPGGTCEWAGEGTIRTGSRRKRRYVRQGDVLTEPGPARRAVAYPGQCDAVPGPIYLPCDGWPGSAGREAPYPRVARPGDPAAAGRAQAARLMSSGGEYPWEDPLWPISHDQPPPPATSSHCPLDPHPDSAGRRGCSGKLVGRLGWVSAQLLLRVASISSMPRLPAVPG